MHVAQCQAEWTFDLIDALSVLTRLVTLEEAQLHSSTQCMPMT